MKIGELYVIYKILKQLVLPWTAFDAYKLGIIDDQGKHLRSPETKEEKEAYNAMNRFTFNLKRLMGLVTGKKNINAQRVMTLFLLREGYNPEDADNTSKIILKETKLLNLNESVTELDDEYYLQLIDLAVF